MKDKNKMLFITISILFGYNIVVYRREYLVKYNENQISCDVLITLSLFRDYITVFIFNLFIIRLVLAIWESLIC